VKDNTQEVMEFFGQSGKNLTNIFCRISDKMSTTLKSRIQAEFGQEYGEEACLPKFHDFVDYLNLICKGPVRKILGVKGFTK
jgi:hypothetical protein